LGGEQSGHIAGVGFDLYVRLVGEAVADFRDPEHAGAAELVDVKVDLPVDANLPPDYVPGERLRLSAYRSLAEASTAEAVDGVRAELIDRFGPVPPQVENLLAVAHFRVHARSRGVTEVSLQGNAVRFSPVDLPDSAQMRLRRLYPRSTYKTAVSTLSVPRPAPEGGTFGASPVRDMALLKWCGDVLEAVAG
jgi:transcription-repair coupling factor (superfamily II helicase)